MCVEDVEVVLSRPLLVIHEPVIHLAVKEWLVMMLSLPRIQERVAAKI